MPSSNRKVEGEAKGEGHGDGGAAHDGISIPLRRWEDWERSRLRKLKREERRRREMERLHSNYLASNGDLLSARTDIHSQYDGSDTFSVTSSEDDHWGAQIGGYNENSVQYPPPPIGLMPRAHASAETVAEADLEAMLEVGFDDRPSHASSRNLDAIPRFQLSDSRTGNGYAPLARSTSPGARSPTSPSRSIDAMSSAIAGEHKTHAKKRSGGRSSGGRSGTREYGPLGPLDPGTKF